MSQHAARAVLVVSADCERRDRWASLIERGGDRAIRCAGPLVGCVLLLGRPCPLLEEADLALYDKASLTPPFVRALAGQDIRPPAVFSTTDSVSGIPRPLRLVRAGRGQACFRTLS